MAVETLQIARANTTSDALKALSKLLINRLIKQGGKHEEIRTTLNKMFGRHFQTFGKICDTTMSFVNFVMYWLQIIFLMTIFLLASNVLRTTLFRISYFIDFMSRNLGWQNVGTVKQSGHKSRPLKSFFLNIFFFNINKQKQKIAK